MSRPILPNGALVVAGMLGMASMVLSGGGRPAGPQPEGPWALDATTPITYFIADGTGKPGFRPADRWLAEWAFEAWERVGAGRFRLQPTAVAEAIRRLYWADGNDCLYGRCGR